ncbi:MAG: acyl-CoA desaturase [Planctomycetia bacterium]
MDSAAVTAERASTAAPGQWAGDDETAAPPVLAVLEETPSADGPAAGQIAEPGAGLASEPRQDGRGAVEGVDWPVVAWILGIHVAALAAPFCFSWSGLVICLGLYWITGSFGVCLGYHRLLTHGSFQTFRPVRLFFAWLGGVSGEGSALLWVANHRKHHVFSDQDGDPHTPRDGGLWAHMLWMFPRRTAAELEAHVSRWAPDLDRDPALHFLARTFLLWHVLIGAALLASGWWLGGPRLGVSWLVWGLALRMVIVFHVTWLVNSATHMWGYRNYETTDDSRNLWWVGLLAFGEGWHNNPHAYQRMAKHGHRWWEVDTTYWGILVLERLGLAWNVVHDRYGRSAAAKAGG